MCALKKRFILIYVGFFSLFTSGWLHLSITCGVNAPDPCTSSLTVHAQKCDKQSKHCKFPPKPIIPEPSAFTHTLPTTLPITAFNLHKLLGIPSPPYPPTHRNLSYKHTHTHGHFHVRFYAGNEIFFSHLTYVLDGWFGGILVKSFVCVCVCSCVRACVCVCGTWWINDCSALSNAGSSWAEHAFSQQHRHKLHLSLYYYCWMWQANRLTRSEVRLRNTILKRRIHKLIIRVVFILFPGTAQLKLN